MDVEEIFTPNGYPNHTYVKQGGKKLETNLKRGLDTPSEVVSLSGPSKSGKTVLVQNVVDDDSLIIVQGSNIGSSEDLWDEVLDVIGVPSSTESYFDSGKESGGKIRAGIKSMLPGLNASTSTEVQTKISKTTGETETYGRHGLRQVAEDISNDKYTILIDDFHYISRDVQESIAQVIKEAARQEISVCVALVPHRSDDLVRANSDLRGRVRGLDVGYWNIQDLNKIASKGFEILNV